MVIMGEHSKTAINLLFFWGVALVAVAFLSNKTITKLVFCQYETRQNHLIITNLKWGKAYIILAYRQVCLVCFLLIINLGEFNLLWVVPTRNDSEWIRMPTKQAMCPSMTSASIPASRAFPLLVVLLWPPQWPVLIWKCKLKRTLFLSCFFVIVFYHSNRQLILDINLGYPVCFAKVTEAGQLWLDWSWQLPLYSVSGKVIRYSIAYSKLALVPVLLTTFNLSLFSFPLTIIRRQFFHK